MARTDAVCVIEKIELISQDKNIATRFEMQKSMWSRDGRRTEIQETIF